MYLAAAAASVGVGRGVVGIHLWCPRATRMGTAGPLARVKDVIVYEFRLGIGLNVAQHQHRADENRHKNNGFML